MPPPDSCATQLEAAVAGTVDPQLAGRCSSIIGSNDPDVLLINEFDTGTDGDPTTVALFAELAGYPYSFTAPSNTGIPSGFDLDNNGTVGGGNDAFGFGAFPGQFGMAVFSKYPIDDRRRCARSRRSAGPTCPAPCCPSTRRRAQSWYSPEELAVFRLSSKSHWDVPIDVGHGRDVHFLVSHPTPPVFDGPEDRNGTPQLRRDPLLGRLRHAPAARRATSTTTPAARAVSAPASRSSSPATRTPTRSTATPCPGAIQQLLDHPRVNTRLHADQRGRRRGDARCRAAPTPRTGAIRAFDTADFADTAPGNLRADYVLPSRDLRIDGRAACSGPMQGEPGSELDRRVPVPVVGPPPRLRRRPAPLTARSHQRPAPS